MWKTVSVTVFALFALISLANVQEELTPEDIFRWVPEGEYSRIYHLDKVALEKADTLEWFETVTGHWPQQFPYEPLPVSMKDEFESRTIFQMARIKVSLWKKGDKVEAGTNPTGYSTVGGKSFMYTNIGEHLFVYRFADASLLIKNALKAGEISSTDTTVMDMPVYAFTHSGEPFYLLGTDSQEVLLTRTLKLLRLMVSTGFGQTPGMFHDQNYADLIELTPTLGQYWTAYDFANSDRVDIAIMKQKGVDQEEITRAEENLQTTNHLNIVNWIVGDTLQEQRVFVFGNGEWAKGYEQRIKEMRAEADSSNNPEEYQIYHRKKAKSEEWIVDGSIVRLVYTYDDTLVKSYLKGFKALEAMRKDAENRKKERKD